MNKLLILLFLFFSLINLYSCAQKKGSLPVTFIHLLNEYKRDSLNILTSDNFQLKEAYINYTTKKANFLDTFLVFSKAINGKFNIVKILSTTEPIVILVEDVSYYTKYFSLKPLIWKFMFTNKNGKVERIDSDTTIGFKSYMDSFMIKHDNFIKWLNTKYPTETENILSNDLNGLFGERLKEYSSSN